MPCRKIRLPVFLGRRPVEPVDEGLKRFYGKLLAAIHTPLFHEGAWKLCGCSGWPDNQSFQNLLAWSWVKDDDRRLIVVNLSPQAVQARVQVPWGDVQGATWRLTDAFSGWSGDRDGTEMVAAGLYVELQAWDFYFFKILRA